MVSSQLRPKNDGEALKVAKVVLKKRDRNLMANAERAKTIQQLRKARKSKPKVVSAVYGDQLLRRSVRGAMDKEHRILSQRKKWLETKIPSTATTLLIARNSRTPDVQKVKSSLRKLGLKNPGDCRIITTSPENLDYIRDCDAYVYYGVPTPETISMLVHKKAFYLPSTAVIAVSEDSATSTTIVKNSAVAKGTGSKPLPLNNNAIIEDMFGQFGLVCVEDLVEVLIKGKTYDRFEKVAKFIATFRLNHENRTAGSMFRNSHPTRGFMPKIATLMKRLA